MIYIGLDAHKTQTTVAWIDEASAQLSEAYKCPTAQLAPRLAALPDPKRAVLETGANSRFVSRQLESCGLEVTVVDAFKAHRLLEAIKTAKTAINDAQSLALRLAAGHLDGLAIWLPDERTEQLRELTRTRPALAELVRGQAQSHPQARLLATIPGIGPLLALAIVAEIGDLSRFARATNLRSYSGLVPRVTQSGERRWTGPLIKRGNRHLRGAMVLAAQHFSRVTATKKLSLRRWHDHLTFGRGPNVAKVALARRMLNIIFAMLRDAIEFDPARLARSGRL